MSVTALMTKQVDITYKVLIGSDDYGQPTYDSVVTPVQCYYRFMTTSIVPSAYLESADLELFLHPGTQTSDIVGITIDGETYVVAGPPKVEYNPRVAVVSHLVLPVRRGDS